MRPAGQMRFRLDARDASFGMLVLLAASGLLANNTSTGAPGPQESLESGPGFAYGVFVALLSIAVLGTLLFLVRRKKGRF